MSKLTQEDVRSIRTMNYSPSQKTENNDSLKLSPKNSKIKSTMGMFKMFHAEEASNLTPSQSMHKSSQNVHNDLQINLIAVNDDNSPSKRNNSTASFSKEFLIIFRLFNASSIKFPE